MVYISNGERRLSGRGGSVAGSGCCGVALWSGLEQQLLLVGRGVRAGAAADPFPHLQLYNASSPPCPPSPTRCSVPGVCSCARLCPDAASDAPLQLFQALRAHTPLGKPLGVGCSGCSAPSCLDSVSSRVLM